MQRELELLVQIESITGNGSQKIKQDLIAKNLTPKLEYILSICFDPFVTTKLSKIAYKETTNGTNSEIYEEFYSLCEQLKSASAANDILRLKAASLIENCSYPKELKETLVKILIKRMNIGIGAKLINKAIGKELIPDPSLMLAKDEISKIDSWKKIICEFKYDGVRVIAKIDDAGNVQFLTRAFNELPVQFLEKIESQIKQLAAGRTGIFFDGELTDFDRKSVSGKVTSILSGKAAKSIGDTFLFNLFDVDRNEVLIQGKGKTKYPDRRELLEKCFGETEFSHLTLGKKWELTDKEEIWGVYKHIVEIEKGEGVILKSPDHVYECKRSSEWIKLKEIKDCDLEIIGYNQPNSMSTREKKGCIGGFLCKTSDDKLTVSVGSGFSESLLQEIKENTPETYIGKIAKVKYNMLIEDKNGNNSLFLPTLLEIRPDKSVADTFEKLLQSKGKA
jgi:DNA ligase-1